jgi:hypothetical protein
METQQPSQRTGETRLGTFEGYNFREHSAIERTLTAAEVIAWEHDADGEAEFWPAGDCPALAVLFNGMNHVTGGELRCVLELLDAVAGDDEETLLRLHLLVNIHGAELETLTASDIEDLNVHLYRGDCRYDLRKEAAYELFELYWPELYAAWDKTPLDGLRFETDDFLDSAQWQTEEVDLGDTKILLVMPNG